jgi:pSer/pThr/pTyr-binding forkhead associated (FHA) protein
MKLNFNQIEAKLSALLEEKLSLDPLAKNHYKITQQILEKLLRAFEESIIEQADDSYEAAAVYTLHLSPEELSRWQDNHAQIEFIKRSLIELGELANVVFPSPPRILFSEDASLLPDEVNITISRKIDPVKQTASVDTSQDPVKDRRPENAFLIYNKTIFPLNLNVVNIGRREDNHLIINLPQVSRNHAQLRAVRGRYILIDLNSTGGTYVNDNRVSQYTLKAGDVITLADVKLVFGQDSTIQSGETGVIRRDISSPNQNDQEVDNS